MKMVPYCPFLHLFFFFLHLLQSTEPIFRERNKGLVCVQVQLHNALTCICLKELFQ